MNALDKFAPVVKEDDVSRRSILLKGRSGAGKTGQARTLVANTDKEAAWGRKCAKSFGLKPMKMLYVSTERKRRSIDDLFVGRPEHRVWTINNPQFPLTPGEKGVLKKSDDPGLIEVFDYLRNEEHEFDVCYVDSFMRYSWALLEWLMNNTYSKEGNLDTLRAYGLFERKMKVLLDLINDVIDPQSCKRPVHFVATWGAQNGQIIVGGQKVGPMVDYFFEDVFNLETKGSGDDVKYYFRTKTTGDIQAKTSGPVELPVLIEDPNLFQIVNVLQGVLPTK